MLSISFAEQTGDRRSARRMQRELHVEVANDLQELTRVQALADRFLEACGAAPRASYLTSLVLEEMLSNVMRHGYEDRAEHEISVELLADADEIEIRIVDDGRDFDPTSAAPVDTHAPLMERPIGGLGIHLVASMVRNFRHERVDGRNHLAIRI